MEADRTKEKKLHLEEALERGVSMIHLDARRPGVVVPKNLKVDHHLRLNLSWRYNPPDLTLSEWGVRETLSFGGTPWQIAVPWSAIFAITGSDEQQAWLFPEDVPPEMLEAAAQSFGLDPEQTGRLLEEATQARSADAAPPAPLRQGFKPRVVDEEEPAAPAEPAPAAPEEKPPGGDGGAPKRPHLRLVK